MNAEINWMIGYANDPSLHIRISPEEIATLKRGLYTDIKIDEDMTLYLRWNGPFAHLLLHCRTDETGFYGDTFELEMESGEIRKIKGPWSSRASVANRYLPEEKHITEVVLRDSDIGGLACHMLVSELRKLLGSDLELHRVDGRFNHGDTKDKDISYVLLPKPSSKEYAQLMAHKEHYIKSIEMLIRQQKGESI